MTISTDAMQELAEIRSLARDFARAELRPHVENWDHDAALPDAVVAQLAELGFLGMLVPEAHGGMGFDMPSFVAAVEEIAAGEASTGLLVVAHAAACSWFAANGGGAADEWLGALASGERVATIPLLAPDAAADAGAAAWLARPDGAAVAVHTRDGRRVADRLDGARIGAPHATMGLRPLALADATPAENSTIADSTLESGGIERVAWLGAAAVATGIAAAAVEHARDYAAEREQFGAAIRTFEGIATQLGDMQIRTAAARALLASAAAGLAAPAEARVFAADTAMWVTTHAVQIFGGYGYMRDYPVEKLMRDAKAAALLFGESDALRVAVADSLYRG